MRAVSDADLVARCREGDEAAWKALVERYAALIYSVPRRSGLQPAAAEDVFSDVCAALLRSLDAIRDPAALPQWLIRTALRATWEAARKGKPAPRPPMEAASDDPSPVDAAAALEEEQIVRDALAILDERCRRLLSLLYFAAPAPSYDDIARDLGMPRGSLGPTRRRCLDRLRAALPERLGGGER